jgi:hypothetical protein
VKRSCEAKIREHVFVREAEIVKIDCTHVVLVFVQVSSLIGKEILTFVMSSTVHILILKMRMLRLVW